MMAEADRWHIFLTSISTPHPFTLWSNWADHLMPRATALIVNLLVVAGAYLVGKFIGSLLTWIVQRWVFRRQFPEPFKQLCSLMSGLLLAVLAALLVFGSGGGSWLGGGSGLATGSQEHNVSRVDSSPSAQPQTPEKPAVEPANQRELTHVVRVTVLAGKAVRHQGRFYILDDNPEALSFEELTALLWNHRQAVKDKLTLRIQFLADPERAPPLNDPKVVQLAQWARQEAGMDVTFPTSITK
jgi:hypothetical protein